MKRFISFVSCNAGDDLHANLLLLFPFVGEKTGVEKGEVL